MFRVLLFVVLLWPSVTYAQFFSNLPQDTGKGIGDYIGQNKAKLHLVGDGVTCGWWSLHGCYPNPYQARHALTQHPSRAITVINTRNYKNFRNGFFCLAAGPFDQRQEAQKEVRKFGGYVKHDGQCPDINQPRTSGTPACLGGYWAGNHCVCPPGTLFDTGQCRSVDHGGVNCAAYGQAYYNGVCVKLCPPGFYNNRGFCQPR